MLEINFHKSLLSSSNFSDLKLQRTSFKECTANETDFAEADLTGCDFGETDLTGSLFHNTDLSEANLVAARAFTINPFTNNLKGAKVSIPEALDLVKYLGVIIE